MVLDNPPSPNAIPPRTSSTNFINGINTTNNSSTTTNSNHASVSPSKPVLRPLSEVDWLSQSKRQPSPSTLHPPPPTSAHRTHRPRQQSLPSAMTSSNSSAAGGGAQPPGEFGKSHIYAVRPGWSAEKERIALGPFEYLVNHPGKDIRAQLIAAFNRWLKVPEESLEVIRKVVGMLHTASLL